MMCNNLPQSKSTFHIRRNFIMSRDTTVAIISIALVSVSNLSCASEQVQNSGFIPGSRWCTYDGVNDVQSIHNASVKRINDVSTSAACQGLATQAKVLTYTWHDSTNGDYAYACILRVDNIWNPSSEPHHYSGYFTAGSCPSGPAPPDPTPACSLNGVLSLDSHGQDTCVCDPGWTGPTCGQLDLLPAPPLTQQVSAAAATSSSNRDANSTWGISVVGPTGGIYHGYMTEIANECPLGDYGVASQVVHMTAPSPLGPWQRRGVALAGFAHNPQALLAPNGSILLFHIGTELQEGCVANCTGLNGSMLPRPSYCTTPSHAVSVAVAESPYGPFTRFPYILQSNSVAHRTLRVVTAGVSDDTNPSAMLAPDGTGRIILTRRRATSAKLPLFVGHWSSPAGPWVEMDSVVLPTNAGSPSTFEEDPFIFSNARGEYHILTHREVDKKPVTGVQDPTGAVLGFPGNTRLSWITGRDVVWMRDFAKNHTDRAHGIPPPGVWLCGGGHLFSRDLKTWYYGENIYGHSANDTAQCDIEFARGGGTVRAHLTSRQRPTIFADATTGRQYLYSGASVNQSEYVHSFTLIQPLYSGSKTQPPE